MSRARRAGAWAVPALVAALLACPGREGALAQEAPAAAPATPAAGPSAPTACGTQAARYEGGREGGKGFGFLVTRAGQVRAENPLRPLTPEVTQVLQVVIAGKVATVYGPDLTALRRGGAPAAVEAMLGAPIRWEAALPALPDPIAIVGDDGTALAQLAFRACEAPPAVKAAPQAAGQPQKGRKAPAREGNGRNAKTPAGFSMPQGAIAE